MSCCNAQSPVTVSERMISNRGRDLAKNRQQSQESGSWLCCIEIDPSLSTGIIQDVQCTRQKTYLPVRDTRSTPPKPGGLLHLLVGDAYPCGKYLDIPMKNWYVLLDGALIFTTSRCLLDDAWSWAPRRRSREASSSVASASLPFAQSAEGLRPKLMGKVRAEKDGRTMASPNMETPIMTGSVPC